MHQSIRWIYICVALILGLSLVIGCSVKDLSKVGNIKLGKYAQTITVDKDDLGKKIKTQWGSFKFGEKQVKKIKSLKSIRKLKNKKAIKKNTFTAKKSIKSKTVMIAVTYLGKGQYQLVMGAL
jgi:hypothetical protein